MICKETIKQRKKQYGNNFKDIASLWNEYFKELGTLNKKVTEKQVAMSMALMKKARIDNIKSKLQEIKDTAESFDDTETLRQIKSLNNGLEDSIKDYNNYLWIAENYEEYERL